ncbi:MAG: CDP-2,3-bis-(O-geranylgeranyl)-sn-glycerol synthase [Candidatus Diapherotrites archaeon]|jgi:CDP-2,3-bis-(O-geranylgeranyl)-sn-glycerol synthase|uniref:CDP-2,3-bis-(O-geranylgeranyl)-sn-glycerol synthase n=1 Tax=Candidatus Iainarchaeum sp. TaxID=3101447 RepID=A0A8T5GGR1_9ARCH|nr:CDP-2,3-bis-(O-geranylgeranyl)-sn-glycerol synthase [Candidatus Diapherotrites archaeon]MBT7241529.1 CDP-2,3-bis-(O-geranylgeranyl)-sn-glycerol synthase [Candidatus Diapherotrites archaeon]
MILESIILILAYLVPLYVANATPILFHGKVPVDFGKKYKGERILGKGKTILGALCGVLGGVFAGIIFYLAIPQVFELIPNYFSLIIVLSIGGIVGDMAKSFAKRRVGIKSGGKWFLVDQLDFIMGGLIFSLIVRLPEIHVVLFLLIATVFIHTATNIIAFKLKLKKVPW